VYVSLDWRVGNVLDVNVCTSKEKSHYDGITCGSVISLSLKGSSRLWPHSGHYLTTSMTLGIC